MKRYRAIRDALNKAFPHEIKGNTARRLNTLAAMICGIVGNKSCHLPKIAQKFPDGTKPDSRGKRFKRCLKNEKLTDDLHFLPFAKALLAQLSHATIDVIIDGSIVGRNCVCLMTSVYYRK